MTTNLYILFLAIAKAALLTGLGPALLLVVLYEYLDGAPCYYDGSGLNAERVFQLLVEKGSEAVWKYLEECYHEQFDNLAVGERA